MKLSIKGKIMSLHNVDEILDEGGKGRLHDAVEDQHLGQDDRLEG
jgi:hypothetical protein